LALTFLVGLVVANGLAIIGIDLGTDYMKVGVVRPGRSFEIVLNEVSKRKSQTMLSIFEGEREYGTNAFGMYTRKPKSALLRLKDLIGKSADHPAFENLEKHGYIYEVVVDETSKDSGFKLKFDTKTEEDDRSLFRVEELIAMILQYAKRIAEDYSETTVKDAVITVPSYFSQFEREALLDAAEIAGLNVLTLVDENAAAALQHGIYKEFPNETSTILIYNMGAASTQVTVVDFWGKPVKNSKNLTQLAVRAKAWDETLGGSEFDLRVAKYLAEIFNEQNDLKGDKAIQNFARPMARIRKEAIKIKEVLSANEEIPVSIQSLLNDIDLFTSISRKGLESMSEDLFERVTKPIDEALKKAGITKSDLDGVEIIGGSVRIPKVKQILTDYFTTEDDSELELGQHLNGDEAMALGAVFIGANLSKGFRVRNIGFTDITTFPVGVDIFNLEAEEDDQWNKHALLFNHNNSLNSRKVVTFQHIKDITCTLTDEGNSVPLAQYDVKGIIEANDKYGHLGKPKVSLTFLLSLNGTAELVKAEATFIEKIVYENETKDEENKTTDVKDENDDEKAEKEDEKAEKEVEKDDEKDDKNGDGKDDEKDDEKDDRKDDEKGKEKENEKDENSNSTKTKKPKGPSKKTHRVKLSFERMDKGVPQKGLSAEEKKEGKALLAKWKILEAAKALHEQARNELESFVFACRDRLRSNEEDVAKVSSEEDVQKLFNDLEEVEDWLYEEGENAETTEYKSKQKELAKRVNKIFSRIGEMIQLPLTKKAARELVTTLKTQIANWTVERPWISEEEFEVLQKQMNSFVSWLDNAEAEQDALSSQDDPVLTSVAIVNELEQINFAVEQILKRRKPRPKKPKVNKTKIEENSSKTENEETVKEESDGTEDTEEEKQNEDTANDESEGEAHDEL